MINNSSIIAFLDKAVFNPAAGNEKISFPRMVVTLFVTIMLVGIVFSLPFNFPDNNNILTIKLMLLFALLLIMGILAILSIQLSKATSHLSIFKSIILFDCQCACMIFLAPIISVTFYASFEKLIVVIIESAVIVFIFMVSTIVYTRCKISKGNINSREIKPPKYPIIISMLAYVVTIRVGMESIGLIVHVAILIFSTPFIILTFNLMQLFYARKYNLQKMLENEAYKNRARSRKER